MFFGGPEKRLYATAYSVSVRPHIAAYFSVNREAGGRVNNLLMFVDPKTERGSAGEGPYMNTVRVAR